MLCLPRVVHKTLLKRHIVIIFPNVLFITSLSYIIILLQKAVINARTTLPFLSTTFLSTATRATNMHRALQVKLLSEHAVMPTRGSPLAAGFDLSSAEDAIVSANGGRVLVKTDLSIVCPEGTYGRIAPRSGLAYKHGIDVGAGVVDADYRGPVGVILFNFGKEDFVIHRGDRIAQLILEQVCMAEAVEVEELNETVRGGSGFGSTGVQAKKQRVVSPSNTSDEASS
jgi:dUTP pyrophosphatase